MEELRQIYNSLTSSEKRFVRNYYKNDPDKKRLRLFQLLEEGIEISDEDAMKEIYGEISKTAFSHLKSRLKKDIMSVLLFQEGDKQSAAPYRQAEIDCRRLLIEGDLLLKRGVYKTAVKTLKKAKKLADQYELTAEAIIIEDLLRTHIGFKKGLKEFNEYSKELHSKFSLMEEILEAKEVYNKIGLGSTFKKNEKEDYLTYAKKSYKKLQSFYENTKSPTVGYYYYLTALYYFHLIKDYESALNNAKNLLQLLENSSSIKSSTRIANANLQVTDILIYSGQYQESIHYANETINHLGKGLMNELVSLQWLFFAQFHSGALDQAGQTLERAFAHPKRKASDFLHGKWWFYRASFYFAKGNYDDSLNALDQNRKLLKDKSTWMLGTRLLEIMNFVEQEQFRLIDFRVEALRKLLQKQKKKTRIQSILKILQTLVNNHYDFDIAINKEKELIRKLKDGEEDFYWDPMGFEMIRFEEWVGRKSLAFTKD